MNKEAIVTSAFIVQSSVVRTLRPCWTDFLSILRGVLRCSRRQVNEVLVRVESSRKTDGTSQTRGLIWFIWFNQTNETDQINKLDQPRDAYAFVPPLCSAPAARNALLRNRKRSVINCWEMVRALFVTQYNTRPAGKFTNRNVMPTGSTIMIFA